MFIGVAGGSRDPASLVASYCGADGRLRPGGYVAGGAVYACPGAGPGRGAESDCDAGEYRADDLRPPVDREGPAAELVHGRVEAAADGCAASAGDSRRLRGGPCNAVVACRRSS